MPNHETDKRYKDKPVRVILNDKELDGLGYRRMWDGAVCDNRDHFFEAYPDPISTYDTRTMVAVSKSLMVKLLIALEAAKV